MATDPGAVLETAVHLIVIGILLWVFGQVLLTLLPNLIQSGLFDPISTIGWKVATIVIAAFAIAWLLERDGGVRGR